MSLIDLASLVLAPTATKEGKVYSAIPDTGEGDMTFTRGSSATRVNSAGLIEKERGNLLLQSNTFDTTWVNTNVSVTGGQSGYDGSSDAWKVDISSSFAQVEQSISSSGVQTFSVYAKAGSLNWVRLRVDHSTFSGTYFDLQNGLVGTTASDIYSTIEDVGSGWYRCSLSYNNNITKVRIYPAQADNDLTATSGNILIQDAMLNEGLVAQPYIETTTTAVYEGITDDVPRVDYSGGGCPSLLLEPQRTNVVTNSEYIASITDLTNGDGTISSTSNYAISPEGVKNATRIQASATGTNYALKSYTPTSSVSGNYTCSMYIKSNTSLNQSINFYARGGNNVITVTPEWQRFVVVGVGSTNFVNFGITQASGQENIDILCYGLQMEQDVTYPTSYLPTYGTSTTRVQDSCSKTGISELIGQTEGVLYAEVQLNVKPESGSPVVGILTTNNNVSDLQNCIILGVERNATGTNSIYCVVQVSNVTQAALFGSSITDGNYKIALAYKANDFALYVNGVQVATDTSGSVPTTSQVLIGTRRNSDNYTLADRVSEAILFPTRLTNDQLQELTK